MKITSYTGLVIVYSNGSIGVGLTAGEAVKDCFKNEKILKELL